jgi:hypothetical protein
MINWFWRKMTTWTSSWYIKASGTRWRDMHPKSIVPDVLQSSNSRRKHRKTLSGARVKSPYKS